MIREQSIFMAIWDRELISLYTKLGDTGETMDKWTMDFRTRACVQVGLDMERNTGIKRLLIRNVFGEDIVISFKDGPGN